MAIVLFVVELTFSGAATSFAFQAQNDVMVLMIAAMEQMKRFAKVQCHDRLSDK